MGSLRQPRCCAQPRRRAPLGGVPATVSPKHLAEVEGLSTPNQGLLLFAIYWCGWWGWGETLEVSCGLPHLGSFDPRARAQCGAGVPLWTRVQCAPRARLAWRELSMYPTCSCKIVRKDGLSAQVAGRPGLGRRLRWHRAHVPHVAALSAPSPARMLLTPLVTGCGLLW